MYITRTRNISPHEGHNIKCNTVRSDMTGMLPYWVEPATGTHKCMYSYYAVCTLFF